MPFFRSKWMLTSKPSTYQRLPDEYVVCDNCMTIAWCLPQDCLTIGKWLADDCHKTAWQLPNDWLTTAWSTIWQDGSLKVWLATATKYPGLRSWVSQPSWRILNRNLYKIHNPPKNLVKLLHEYYCMLQFDEINSPRIWIWPRAAAA